MQVQGLLSKGEKIAAILMDFTATLDLTFLSRSSDWCGCRIVLADVAMIMLGLFGALSVNNYRWGYYGVSCAFFLVVLWGLLFPAAKGARARGGRVRSSPSCTMSPSCFHGAVGPAKAAVNSYLE